MSNETTTPAQPRATTPDGFKVWCSFDELVELDSLKPNPRNPNKHPEAQLELLANIIKKGGWREKITVSRRSGFIVKGHARREAGKMAGGQYAPVEWQDYATEADEMADLIADNRIAELAVLDEEAITELLAELEANTDGIDPEMSGFTAEQIREMVEKAQKGADEAEQQAARLTLQQKFLIPPFTVLDARGGFWSERKKAWKALGIRSEMGRGRRRLQDRGRPYLRPELPAAGSLPGQE